MYKYENTNGEIVEKPDIVVDTGGGPAVYFEGPFVRRWWHEPDAAKEQPPELDPDEFMNAVIQEIDRIAQKHWRDIKDNCNDESTLHLTAALAQAYLEIHFKIVWALLRSCPDADATAELGSELIGNYAGRIIRASTGSTFDTANDP